MGLSMSSSQGQERQSLSSHGSVIKAIHSKLEWETHFITSQNSNKLLVIDFTAAWCGPCRSMEPVLKELCEKYPDVEFVKIDVDELSEVAKEYGVQAMPTFLLMKGGVQVDIVVGARKDDLKSKIEKHRV